MPGKRSITEPTPQELMIQALVGQGIDTPEMLEQFFTNTIALSGQVKDLQDQLQVLQESKKTGASFEQEVEELKKVFPSSSPAELVIALMMVEKEKLQALQAEIQALKLSQVEERYRQDLKDLDDLNAALRQKTEQGEIAALRQKNQDLDLKLTRIEELHYQNVMDLSDRHLQLMQKMGALVEGIISGFQKGLKETYDQNEFNNAAMAWLRDAGSKLLKDQITIDDKRFLMGYGEHIHRYIAQRKPQGVKPYITPDDHYVVPNSLSEDYIAWARQNVPQQASSEHPNPGF